MKRQATSNMKRLLTVLPADFALLAACLLTFAYFHHVRIKDEAPVAIPTPAQTAAQAPAVSEPDSAASVPETEDAAVSADTGLLGGKYAEKFAPGGEVISDENGYRSENVSVSIEKKSDGKSTYFIADVYIKDVSSFRTAVALDYQAYNTEARKNCMQVLQLDELTNAIVAMSGDNYVFRNAGLLAIRNGMEWDKELPLTDDICAMFYDGTMETFYTKSSAACRAYVEELYTRGVYQVWCFGPTLLTPEGQPKTSFNSSVTGENPRAAFGYYEPGHYCFVLVDGRQKGYSLGMSLAELSQLFYELGCKVAYNLDGGDTVAMTYQDGLLNQPEANPPRSVSDVLYIAEPIAKEG